MKFSELFGISVLRHQEWFDPILSLDTRLFIDPFLLYSQEFGVFQGSHLEVIQFFNAQFQYIAKSGGDRSSVSWKKAQGALVLNEVEELCLGYTGKGTGGSGAGTLLASVIASALWEAVEAGVKEITHFEEIDILREGVGADRISDITANLIRARLCEYTMRICKRNGVPIERVNYLRGKYDLREFRWAPIQVSLPKNPFNGKHVLLVPKKFLRDLPTIDASDFWDYCYSNENETLRAEYSEDVTRHVDKKTIIDFARRHPEIRAKYLTDVESKTGVAYDFSIDSAGLYNWYSAAQEYVRKHPQQLGFGTDAEFQRFVQELIRVFRHYVEENQGWKLLSNDDKTPRHEPATQTLFLGVVKHYCKANNIDFSREANIGRGPVDFKVASGYTRRALVEVKKADNTRFWHGLLKQLPKYLQAEEVRVGCFVVIVYNDADVRQIAEIDKAVSMLNGKLPYEIQVEVVDASYGPPSASKL